MLLKAKVTFTSSKYKNYFAEVDDDHEQLVLSIEAQDAERADQLAQQHAKLIGQRLVAYIQSFSEAGLRLGDPAERPVRSTNDPQRKRKMSS
jgi:DNA-binding GntR family transcriptional regulator